MSSLSFKVFFKDLSYFNKLLSEKLIYVQFQVKLMSRAKG